MAYSSIAKPTDHFNTVLYTGDGNAGRTVTGVGFQPQWLWIKERSSTSTHSLTDIIRGANERLQSTATDAEFDTGTDNVRSFDSDGFTLGTGGQVNENTQTYVSWNWLAGGSASSNGDGSITSSVSANTTAGFSIVSYTGTGSNATVGHGLGVAPNYIIFKNRDESQNWIIGNDSLTSWEYILYLNLTNAQSSSSNKFNSTAPTSSVFSVGTGVATNGSSDNMIAYCFAEKKGYSKFGKYTGNGNADGPFIYTGFKPAFVLIKSTASSTNWPIIDNKRPGYNPANKAGSVMFANTSSAESSSSTRGADFNSNGFKIRGTNNDVNGSSNEITYMAFAKNPFVGNDSGTAVPVTASV